MNKGRGFQRGWWLVLITIGVMYTASVPFIFINPSEDSFLYMLCCEAVLAIPLIVGVFMLFWENDPGGIAAGMGLRGFSGRLLPFILLLPVTAQSFSGFLLMPIQALLTLLFGAQDYGDILETGGIIGFLQNFVVLCVLAPVFEEAICRGVLMQLFKRYGTVVMLVFSSLGFALLHQSAQSLLPVFFLGMVLGLIRITTGSLLAAMAAHSASNLYALILLTAGEMFGMEWLLMAAGVAGFPVLMWYYMKKCDLYYNWRGDLVKEYKPTGFSIGLVVVVVLFGLFNLWILLQRLFDGVFFYEMLY